MPVLELTTLEEATVPPSVMIHFTETFPVSFGFRVSALS